MTRADTGGAVVRETNYEHEARVATDTCAKEKRPRGGPVACVPCIAAALAAAEERGRRRGVEEREKLRLALIDARYWFAANAMPVEVLREAVIARIDAALALRDSGKEDRK